MSSLRLSPRGVPYAAGEQAFDRAVELLDLTIADERWKGRRKELSRARELLCDAMLGGHTYGSDLASHDRYFSTSPWRPELDGERLDGGCKRQDPTPT